MKTLRVLLSSLTLALACFVSAAAQSAQVVGDWEITINSPQGSNTSKAVFKQEGDKLSGVLKNQRGELPVQVTLNGKEITIKFSVKFQDNDLPITLKGNVEGDTIRGTADFGGMAEGDWSGKRAEAAVATESGANKTSATTDGKIDVTGTWAVEVETSAGSGSPTFTFKQEGETLSGQYKGQFGEAPVKGMIKGDEITFSVEVSQGTVVYKGKIENGVMKGVVSLGDLGSGSWTGKRK